VEHFWDLLFWLMKHGTNTSRCVYIFVYCISDVSVCDGYLIKWNMGLFSFLVCLVVSLTTMLATLHHQPNGRHAMLYKTISSATLIVSIMIDTNSLREYLSALQIDIPHSRLLLKAANANVIGIHPLCELQQYGLFSDTNMVHQQCMDYQHKSSLVMIKVSFYYFPSYCFYLP
jgi:hypothetical protein